MSIFSKINTAIKNKLHRSSSKISDGISTIFKKQTLDNEAVEGLEDLLIMSDIGLQTSSMIIEKLKKTKFNKDITEEEVKDFLVNEITKILKPFESELKVDKANKPHVILFAGVNGVGKTTVIGKIANSLIQDKKTVILAACDTFRAAASEQLKVWAERNSCAIVSAEKQGEDPASLAYKALKIAKDEGIDVLLIDTAGRLQNKTNLMDELSKISKVLKKQDAACPHASILVLDATTGQNAKKQIEVFSSVIDISGVIVNKLDGTAKGGILVSIANEYKKPIYAVGLGEDIDDLRVFDAKKFSDALIRK